MRAAAEYITWLIGLPLELLVIAGLIRGLYRRFPLVLLYTIALFLTSVVEMGVTLAYFSGMRLSHTRAFYYWLDEGILQALIYAMVISLIYNATAQFRSRNLVRAGLTIAAVLFAGISFLVHYDPRAVVGMWMTLWSRDLNFTSAVLDLALWAMLLGSQKRDRRLLLLSAGLGIQFTGEAIGQSIRQWLPWTFSPGDALIMVANLACLWIWWQALRHAPVRAAVETNPPVRREAEP